jgi:thioredoxin-like negative regulator of GroEL
MKADTIAHAGQRAMALISIARARVEAGKLAEAVALCAAAHTVATTISYTEQCANIQGALADTLAKAGRWEDAQAIIHAIAEPRWRAAGLRTFARALARAGRWGDAHAATADLADAAQRADAFSDLALALAEAGNTSAATATLNAARSTADSFALHQLSAEVISALASAFIQIGHWDEARMAAVAIPDAGQRSDVLSTLAIVYMRLQRWDAARVIADSIPLIDQRAEGLRILTYALARAARWDDARATADAIPTPGTRVAALRMLIDLLLEAKRWEDARATIDALPATSFQADALSMFASALAQDRCIAEADATFTQARAAIDSIVDEEARADALYTLATALVRAGRRDEARATMEAIPDDEEEDWEDTLFPQARSNSFVPRILSDPIAHAETWGSASADAALNSVEPVIAAPSIAKSVVQEEQLQQRLATLMCNWQQAKTRRELLKSFMMDPAILAQQPDIGIQLLASFDWVDAILRGEVPQAHK